MIATGICYSIELDQFCHSPTKRRECRETTSSEPGNWSRLFLHHCVRIAGRVVDIPRSKRFCRPQSWYTGFQCVL